MAHRDLKPDQVESLLHGSQPWIFVDVRTVEEFEQSHVPGAYNVPLMLRGPAGMVPNPEFLPVMRATFAPGTRMVFG
jgi:rhodanese-related sulfurtransferase